MSINANGIMTQVDLAQQIFPRGGPATSEDNTRQEIRVAASQYGYAMWRNNSGAFQDKTGRWVRFGVGNDSKKINKLWKSPDLIGIGPKGVSVWCEVKHPEWKEPTNDHEIAQLNCLIMICKMGGIGFFATSVHDYLRKIGALKP